MKELKIHPVCQLSTSKPDDAYIALVADMRENGFNPMFPIELNEDGLIIDGRHRYTASLDAGVEAVTVTVDIAEKDIPAYVAKKDCEGKHPSSGQKAAAASDMSNTKQGRNWDSNNQNSDFKKIDIKSNNENFHFKKIDQIL